MKDDYKKLSHEWGSKRRKEDSRAAKSTLKKPTREELAEVVFEGLMDEIRFRMANPPDKCDRCGVVPALRTETHGLFWNGNDWVCDDCAEETQQ